MQDEKKDAHTAALLKDRVKYTTNKDLESIEDRTLIQSSSLALNSTFSLNGFERNFYFENAGKHFENLGAISGIDSDIDARSFAFGDLDRDGDLDIVIKNLQRRLIQFYLNEIPSTGHRVFFHLTGSKSNRDAIGARIEIRHGDRFQMAQVRSSSGFQSQSPTEVFFGLGSDSKIDSVEIFWPSGEKQKLENVAADAFYHIHESKGVEKTAPLEPRAVRKLASDSRATVPKQTLFAKVRKAPPLDEVDVTGRPVRSADLYRNDTLVSFVKSWLPFYEEHLDLLEKIAATHPELQILVVMVEPVDAEALEDARDRKLRFVRNPYARRAPAFAQQTNVLFPSTFLIRDGNIVFDLIGRLDRTKTLEALAEKLSAEPEDVGG